MVTRVPGTVTPRQHPPCRAAEILPSAPTTSKKPSSSAPALVPCSSCHSDMGGENAHTQCRAGRVVMGPCGCPWSVRPTDSLTSVLQPPPAQQVFQVGYPRSGRCPEELSGMVPLGGSGDSPSALKGLSVVRVHQELCAQHGWLVRRPVPPGSESAQLARPGTPSPRPVPCRSGQTVEWRRQLFLPCQGSAPTRQNEGWGTPHLCPFPFYVLPIWGVHAHLPSVFFRPLNPDHHVGSDSPALLNRCT